MNAKLATVDDCILARVEEAGTPRVGGLQFGCGYLSPYFVTDAERMEVVFEDAYILICDKQLSCKSDLMPLLEQITKSGKPLLIVAEDVGGEALATLVVNKLRGPLQVAAVKAPGSEDQRKRVLQDMALLTGCTAITEDLDIQLRSVGISHLGQAQKVIIGKNSTVIEGRASPVYSGCETATNTSSSTPCRSDQATAEPCADRLLPRGTVSQRSNKTCEPRSAPR